MPTKREMLKKIALPVFAAIGVFFVAIIFLSLIISRFAGGEGPLFTDKVAVIDITGVITESREINRQINEYADRDDVKAIILRVDTPGGGVGPSQEIYREVMKARDKKKVITSMGSIAASGGYYIASASHKIVANPGTITGSIGVIIEFANFQELLAKLGLKGFVVKSGPFKDIGSPLREMTSKERMLVQGVVDDLHQQFIGAVSEGRGMERSAVSKIADGRFFSGSQSVELGLVDEIGNFNDAVTVAAELSGVEGKPHLIYPVKRRGGFWEIILENSLQRVINSIVPKIEARYLFS